MFGTDRDEMRRFYQNAWRKFRERMPAEPLELQIAQIVAEHPEYHALLDDDDALAEDYTPEYGAENPFLHMGMHMAIREQVATDRPAGIKAIHAKLATHAGGAHAAEHAMMECLGVALWQAQRDDAAPDEQRYLECLRKLPGN